MRTIVLLMIVLAAGIWAQDKEEEPYWLTMEKRRVELIAALRSRVLSAEEMRQVLAQGPRMMVQMCPTGSCYTFSTEEIERSFNALMLLQSQMRLAQDASTTLTREKLKNEIAVAFNCGILDQTSSSLRAMKGKMPEDLVPYYNLCRSGMRQWGIEMDELPKP